MDLTTPPVVEVAIGELILTGLDRHDGAQLRSGVERHLTRLLREQGLPAGTTSVASDRRRVAVDLDWDGGGGPDGLARALARRIYEAMDS
jgi:hypothetical protein